MKILSFDPSGNFDEGKGTSGYTIMIDGVAQTLGEIKASDFTSQEAYWFAHVELIEKEQPDLIVYEGYRLYNHKSMKASSQANSELETPQLLGVLRIAAFQWNIPMIKQFASDVKTRWSENVLVVQGYLTEKNGRYYFNGKVTSTHKRDSLKHALHAWRYKVKGK